MATVKLEGVRKVYDGGSVAVHGVDLDVRDGELVVLVGPSGCGKSTTLRMIAGLETITAGRLWIGDRLVNDLPAKDRDIAMVFQSYALYPHMSVYENMAFALKLRKLPEGDVRARVHRAARALGLEELLDRRPRQLSGGQRQRVALGRAIVREPKVFLFDEPLSNLDAKLRVQTRREIARLHRDLAATMIYVTHDQVEAMTLGDRIVVMSAGRVMQVGAPLELYERPQNVFVAGFIGSPAMNFLPGRVTGSGAEARFRSDDGALELPLPARPAPADARAEGRRVVFGIRPEDVHVPAAPAHAAPGAEARVRLDFVETLGHELVVRTSTPAHEITARVQPRPLPAAGAEVTLHFDMARAHLFDAETEERIG